MGTIQSCPGLSLLWQGRNPRVVRRDGWGELLLVCCQGPSPLERMTFISTGGRGCSITQDGGSLGKQLVPEKWCTVINFSLLPLLALMILSARNGFQSRDHPRASTAVGGISKFTIINYRKPDLSLHQIKAVAPESGKRGEFLQGEGSWPCGPSSCLWKHS